MADDLLQTAVAVRIDGLCQQYEAAWQRGERPSLDEFVARADPADQDALRAELQRLAFAYSYRQELAPKSGNPEEHHYNGGAPRTPVQPDSAVREANMADH